MEIKSTTGLEVKLMVMDVPVGWTSHVQVIIKNLNSYCRHAFTNQVKLDNG